MTAPSPTLPRTSRCHVPKPGALDPGSPPNVDSGGRKPDGGPAFPQLSIESGQRDGHGDLIDPITATQGGLSRRAYYAAHAPFTLHDAMAYHPSDITYERALRTLAQIRFAYADAMLAAEAEHG